MFNPEFYVTLWASVATNVYKLLILGLKIQEVYDHGSQNYAGEDQLLLNRIFFISIIIVMLHCCAKYLHAFMSYLFTRPANPKGDIKLAG